MAIQILPSAVSSSAMPLISPSALLQAYLSQDPPIRPSNRTLTQTRPIHLNTGSLTHCNGSSLVKLGESTIVCGIRAELLPVSEIAHYRSSESARVSQEQTEEDSYEAVTLNNLLVPNLELSTNCHPSFPANVAPTVTAQSISQRVLSLLHSSRFVSVASLEIRHTSDPAASGSAGLDPDDPAYVEPERDVLKAYWTLYIDCVALSYGGEANVFDTTLMAVIAALKDVRIPQARWDEDSKQIFCDPDYTKASILELRGLPCPLSFGVFGPDSRIKFSNEGAEVNGTATPSKQKSQGATILLDIDYFENDVCTEKGNIVVDWSSRSCRILRLEKVGGGGVIGLEGIKQIVDNAEKRCQEWKAVLDGASGSGG